MSDIVLSNKAAKLMKLCEAEGFDSLDDIFGAPSGDVRVEPIRAPADYKPRDFSEPCPKAGTRNSPIFPSIPKDWPLAILPAKSLISWPKMFPG